MPARPDQIYDLLTPSLGSDIDVMQGFLTAWNSSTYANTVTVNGATLTDLPVLTAAYADQLGTDVVVGILRVRNVYYIIGRYSPAGGSYSGGGGGGGTVGGEASYYQSGTAQSITNATHTRVRFDATDYSHADVTPTSSGGGHYFTLNRSGIWTVSTSLRMEDTGTGARFGILTHGTDVSGTRYAQQSVVSAGEPCAMSISVTRRFTSGDTVAQWIYQATGASRSMNNASDGNRITLTWVRE